MGIGKDRAKASIRSNSNFWSRQLKIKKESDPTIFKKDSKKLEDTSKPKFISKDIKNHFAFNRSPGSRNSVTYDLDSVGETPDDS